jgi:hypothetical protein
VYVRSGTTWTLQQKLFANDPAARDRFGNAVALAGDTAVISAPGQDDGIQDAGAIYIFTRSGTTWTQQAKLRASNADVGARDFLGNQVALSSDGLTAVAASPLDDDAGDASGSVYVFFFNGASWGRQAKLTASDAAAGDEFGRRVDIDGDTIVVGASGKDSAKGAAYVFTRVGTTWSQEAKLTASDGAAGNEFGRGVAVSGDNIVVGSYLDDGGGTDAGSVTIFTRDGTTWTEEGKLGPSGDPTGDFFGRSVSLQGSSLVVGAYGEPNRDEKGEAYIFTCPF